VLSDTAVFYIAYSVYVVEEVAFYLFFVKL